MPLEETQSQVVITEPIKKELNNTIFQLLNRKAQIDLEVSELTRYLDDHNRNAQKQKTDYEQQIESKTTLSNSLQLQVDLLNEKIKV
jgi:hypothetical protein